jgi:hypothetical protein
MENGMAFDRVKALLEEMPNLPSDVLETRVKELEPDIFTLFHKLERLHVSHPELVEVDLSNNVYALAGRLEQERLKKSFPLLARAAAMFTTL